MATIRWRGDSVPVAQVSSWTFAGTWLSTETITVTIGDKTATMITGSTAIATIIANLTAYFNGLDQTAYPEFAAEITFGNDTVSVVTATAKTAGEPFTVALSTNSASGTITGPSATVASAGPSDASTGANYSSGSTPGTADALVIDIPATITSGLASISSVASVLISAPCTIGRPDINPGGYFEYRPTYWSLAAPTWTFSTGVAGGSCSFRIDPGSHATTINVFGMGAPSAGATYALQIKNCNSTSALNIQQGVIGVAVGSGETSTIPTISVGYVSSPTSDVSLTLGSGCTLTTINQGGGSVTVNSSVATAWTITAGTAFLISGTIAALKALPSDGQTVAVTWDGGTITSLVFGNASVTADRTEAAKTATNTTIYAGFNLQDGGASIVFTNPPVFTGCSPFKDGTINRGTKGGSYSLAI